MFPNVEYIKTLVNGLKEFINTKIKSVRKDIDNLPQSDWNQNENLQPDYIRNRTHYKEIDEDGNEVYHTLDNKYLNLDKEISQGSDNPVTSKAVYKAVTEVEMESLSNLEIEELIKNFV